MSIKVKGTRLALYLAQELRYWERLLPPEHTNRYDEWRTDDAGADLIKFMSGLPEIPNSKISLEEVCSGIEEIITLQNDLDELRRMAEVAAKFQEIMQTLS